MTRLLTLSAFGLAAILALPALADDPKVFATYHVDNGSLPPDDAWSADATILTDGSVVLTSCTGYVTEGAECQTQRGQAPDAAMAVIRYDAAESGLGMSPAKERPDPPIGGGGASGTVILDGITIVLPRDPAPEDVERVARVLNAVVQAIHLATQDAKPQMDGPQAD